MQIDILIIGQGISGTCLSYYLSRENVSFLIIDDERKNAPSRVAAGIINPVTGRRIVRTWMIEELLPYTWNFYTQLGTSIIFGTKVDQAGTKIFLPFELKNSLEKTTFQNQPLVNKSKTLLSFEKEIPSSWWNNIYTYLLLLGFVVLAHHKVVDKIYLLILSLIGIFFLTVGFYSLHQELAMICSQKS